MLKFGCTSSLFLIVSICLVLNIKFLSVTDILFLKYTTNCLGITKVNDCKLYLCQLEISTAKSFTSNHQEGTYGLAPRYRHHQLNVGIRDWYIVVMVEYLAVGPCRNRKLNSGVALWVIWEGCANKPFFVVIGMQLKWLKTAQIGKIFCMPQW